MIQIAGSIPVWGDPIDEGVLAQLRLTQQHPDVNGEAMAGRDIIDPFRD